MEQKQKDLISPELVRQAKAGDQAAFTELYRRTSMELYRSIRSMVREEELAWDIMQDSYLRAWKGLANLREDQSLLPWLRRIAVNVTADTMAQRRPLCFTDLAGEADTEPVIPDLRVESQPELALDRKETARLVKEILAQLPEGQQMILGMHYYEGMPVKEIADTLKLSPNTVKVQMHRGRKGVETRVRQLEAQGVKLYGFSPLPFLLALLRRLEPLPDQKQKALGGLLSQTQAPAEGAVTAITATAVGQGFFHSALGKAALGLLVLGLVGGGVKLGYDYLQEQQTRMGLVRFVEDSPEELPITSEEAILLTKARESTQAPTEPDTARPQQENPDAPRDPTPENPPASGPTQPPRPTSPTPTQPAPTEPPAPSEPARTEAPAPSETESPAPPETTAPRLESEALLQGSYQNMDWALDLKEKWLELDSPGSLDLAQLNSGDGLWDQLMDPETRSQYDPYLRDLERVTLYLGGRVTQVTGLMTLLQSHEFTDVEIPVSLTQMELEDLGHCSLARFHVAAGNPSYSSDSQGLLYNKDKTRLLRCPPSCQASISLPAGLTTVNPAAFRACVYLKQLQLPDSLQQLGERAFQDCVTLESLNLPQGLQSLPQGCFEGCRNLAELRLPAGLKQLGARAFAGCEGFKSLRLPDGIQAIPQECFQDAYFQGEGLQLPQGLTAIGDRAFSGCGGLENLQFPQSLTRIGAEAFADSRGLGDLVLPAGLTQLGPGAFQHCYLYSVVLPATLKEIPERAFYYNYESFKRLTISEGVEHIGSLAFADCRSLVQVHVPGSVTRIDDYALGYSYNDNTNEPGGLFDDFNMTGPAASEAERYARDNGIPFQQKP